MVRNPNPYPPSWYHVLQLAIRWQLNVKYKLIFWVNTYMALVFFRIWCGMCYTLFCEVKLPLALFSDRTQVSAEAFFPLFFSLVFFPSLHLAFSTVPAPIHPHTQLYIPPSFSPCLLSFLPSFQSPTSADIQSDTESGWKIWLDPSLTSDNVQDCWQAWHHKKQGNAERERESIPDSESLSRGLLNPLKQKVLTLCSFLNFLNSINKYLLYVYLFIFFINDLQNKKSSLGITRESLLTVEIHQSVSSFNDDFLHVKHNVQGHKTKN